MQHLPTKLDGLSSALPSSNDATYQQSRPVHDPVQTPKTPRVLVGKEGILWKTRLWGPPRLEFVADPVF